MGEKLTYVQMSRWSMNIG